MILSANSTECLTCKNIKRRGAEDSNENTQTYKLSEGEKNPRISKKIK